MEFRIFVYPTPHRLPQRVSRPNHVKCRLPDCACAYAYARTCTGIEEIQAKYTALRGWLLFILPHLNPNGGRMLHMMHTHYQRALDYTNQLLDYFDEYVVEEERVNTLAHNIPVELRRARAYVSSFIAVHHPRYPRSANNQGN
ncbi:hypothetical protein N7488_000076 [Penicillium malachiteum]|nr:hypothetical protein N7488_000076 [Penicillium malachiteum]